MPLSCVGETTTLSLHNIEIDLSRAKPSVLVTPENSFSLRLMLISSCNPKTSSEFYSFETRQRLCLLRGAEQIREKEEEISEGEMDVCREKENIQINRDIPNFNHDMVNFSCIRATMIQCKYSYDSD